MLISSDLEKEDDVAKNKDALFYGRRKAAENIYYLKLLRSRCSFHKNYGLAKSQYSWNQVPWVRLNVLVCSSQVRTDVNN